jgi:TRAP-type C4-dicarboxylate transport system substrate-binding protein
MIVDRLLLWATSGLVFLFALLGSALAADVRLATTQPDDTFISSFRSSRYLAKAGIRIAVVKVPTDDDALNAVMKGSAELGLFEFGVFSNRKFEKQPELFSVFTRPFLFHSASELLDVQNTPVGDAVLADVRQVGIFPLSFWNRGLSQIWTRQPVNTAEHLRGLTVGENSDRPPNREREMIFTSLGVKSTKAPPQAMADAFSNGRLSGYVFENTDS